MNCFLLYYIVFILEKIKEILAQKLTYEYKQFARRTGLKADKLKQLNKIKCVYDRTFALINCFENKYPENTWQRIKVILIDLDRNDIVKLCEESEYTFL